LPSYTNFNARAGWAFTIAGLDSYFNVNVYNLFNVNALVEAEDRTVDNDGVYSHVFYRGYWTWGRNFNFALTVNF
jgi:hypothetical protein